MYNIIHPCVSLSASSFVSARTCGDALGTYADRYGRSEADVIREALWLFLEAKGYRPPRRRGQRKK